MSAVKEQPCLAIITATYNEFSKIESWQQYYAAIAAEIDLHIIVDDGSTVEYLQLLKKTFPNSIILQNETNQGQIAAHNLGFKYALSNGARFVGVLVPDFRLSPCCLNSLIKVLTDDPTMAGISAVTIKAGTEDEIESVGARLDMRRATLVPHDEVGLRWKSTWEGVKIVDTMHGGFHLLRRSLVETIGLCDEQLFMYCDELDLGWRAKLARLKFGVLLGQRVWHEHVSFGGRTRPPLAVYLVSRNRMLIMNRYGRLHYRLILILGRLVTLIPAMLGYLRREGTVRHARAYAHGLWHGILGITGRPPQDLL